MTVIDNSYLLPAAVAIDLAFGDPGWLKHPVEIIGTGIEILEAKLRPPADSQSGERLAGVVLVVIVVSATYLVTVGSLKISYYVNYYLGLVLNLALLALTLSIKGLARAGNSVYTALQAENLELARRRLAGLVGRDTDCLAEPEIVRAVVETVAENTSDGIIAPICFALVGGVPLAMSYKAVNTLDSMLGYKNKKYRYFGWAAARLDDLANLVPARLTGGLFVAAALLSGQDGRQAGKILLRDGANHPSPNAGRPEAALAGALNLRLGGVNYYRGRKSVKPYLGEAKAELKPEQIKKAVKLMYWALGVWLASYCLLEGAYILLVGN